MGVGLSRHRYGRHLGASGGQSDIAETTARRHALRIEFSKFHTMVATRSAKMPTFQCDVADPPDAPHTNEGGAGAHTRCFERKINHFLQRGTCCCPQIFLAASEKPTSLPFRLPRCCFDISTQASAGRARVTSDEERPAMAEERCDACRRPSRK